MSATHEVLNQSSTLTDVNLWDRHAALKDALKAWHPALDPQPLHALGAEMGSGVMQTHARLANQHAPALHTHDLQGRRIDEVEFHPSYHVLLGAALKHGLHGTPWACGAGAHLERAAGFMLFTESEPSVLCPVSMSYAVTPSLRASAALHAEWGPRVAATVYDGRFVPGHQKAAVTMGMGMTEKQGGSDVRANTTRAVFDAGDAWGRRYTLSGHKWFFSAPMCDAFLVLAQTMAGLSCFFLPRFTPDGELNSIRIQRLKDKLGNQANASSEVEFENATAWLIGDEGRGVAQILAMGALTRLDCALGTAGLMHHALTLALHHCRERQAFGKRLIEQPLMKNVLADLVLESEAATLLAMRLAAAVDRTENGQDADGLEALMRRVLTPIAKFWVCKRGSHFAQEAMECLGGNGYVEAGGQGVMARIYREMPLNSIWEGAGNIQSLDLLRALKSGPVADALMHELSTVRTASPLVARHADALHAALDGDAGEHGARRLARDVAVLLQASLMHRVSPPPLFEAFTESRLAGANDAFGQLPVRTAYDAILSRATLES